MAKDHVLPRYLLWAAVCVCVLLGGGVLVLFHAKSAKSLRSFAEDAKVFSQHGSPEHFQEDIEGKFFADFAIDSLRTLRETYTSEIGIREASGNNDGTRVEEYLRYCNLGPGHAWCAAFVSWCFGQAGYAEPRNPWSPALFPQKRVIWKPSIVIASKSVSQHVGAKQSVCDENGVPLHPLTNRGDVWPGDIFGIHYSNLRRIGHVGFVDAWDGTWCITVEGNTGPDNAVDENGDPANPIRAGPSTEGVYRKRRPVRTIHAVARWQ
ncbi:hypothetical protein [Parapedobacter tibetensis]|uniref:hypothetical protein n=1 Tax=Parapedobacter tibetensis TaxID=2972951 RepID=UPI00214D99F8|nr:hypothetical protein [Parapedobacter tibetensis]